MGDGVLGDGAVELVGVNETPCRPDTFHVGVELLSELDRGLVRVGTQSVSHTGEKALGEDGVAVWRGHLGEATNECWVRVLVLGDDVLGDTFLFSVGVSSDESTKDLDGVLGAKGSESLDIREASLVELVERCCTSRREPFTLHLVGFEAALLALVDVEDGGFVRVFRGFGEKSDVIEVSLGDDSTLEVAVDRYEDLVDDEREEDRASDRSLAGAGFLAWSKL